MKEINDENVSNVKEYFDNDLRKIWLPYPDVKISREINNPDQRVMDENIIPMEVDT